MWRRTRILIVLGVLLFLASPHTVWAAEEWIKREGTLGMVAAADQALEAYKQEDDDALRKLTLLRNLAIALILVGLGLLWRRDLKSKRSKLAVSGLHP